MKEYRNLVEKIIVYGKINEIKRLRLIASRLFQEGIIKKEEFVMIVNGAIELYGNLKDKERAKKCIDLENGAP